MLESAIAAGVTAAGGDALLAGVLPTPAAPLLVRRHGLTLAAVISASHNPYEDNGIKLFAADGFKLDDDTEHAIEAELDNEPPVPTRIGRVRRFHGALEDYLRELHVRFADLDLSGRRVLLDCANGATFRAAPEIFRRLGADVDVLADQPDGRNINDGCGSTHIDPVGERMHAGDYDVAFAFDGDGDRVLAVDRSASVVDGDELIALAAMHLQHRNRLPGHGVAVTVMTNYGFHTAMAAAGIDVATTPVGDRYVLDELRRAAGRWGASSPATSSISASGRRATGSPARCSRSRRSGPATSRARGRCRSSPSAWRTCACEDRASLDAAMSHSSVQSAVAREDEALSGRGRVLVRASGTEPLIRVMVEAPSAEETEQVCARLIEAVRQVIGPGKDGA